MTSIPEYATFFRQFQQRFETTGAIAPSSRFLARAMTRTLRNRSADDGPVRILEIGPGTGAITRSIIRWLRPGDHFDLVELNQVFADHLHQRFETDPRWKHAAAGSEVHVCPAQDFHATKPYDVVISGLPLNNFPAPLVDEMFEVYFKHLAPNGVLSYFEYMYVRSVRKRLSQKSERTRLKAIDRTMNHFIERHRFRRDWIFLNVPPAWIQHLTATG